MAWVWSGLVRGSKSRTINIRTQLCRFHQLNARCSSDRINCQGPADRGVGKPMLSKPITRYRSAKSGRRAPIGAGSTRLDTWYHSASGKQIMRMARIVVLGIAAASVLSPTAASTQGQSEDSKPELHNRNDMQRALNDCLESVRAPECGHEIRLTVRFTFNAHGAFEGPPRITYAAPTVANEIREKYENTIVETLGRCTPLNFSRDFGSTIAGTPLLLRFTRSRTC
jgi:hypothetical protein